MRTNSGPKKPHGEIRQSQLVTTFGPGAMLDLPLHSVLIAGLEFWGRGLDEVVEPRLAAKLEQLLNVNGLRLCLPPPSDDDPTTQSSTGITCFQFPEWFITQDIDNARLDRNIRSRMLVHRISLTRGKLIVDRKPRSVVPVRFVRACRRGHIGDIDWYTYVHHAATDCRRQLWVDEHGTSGDLTDIIIRCECGQQRSMAQASKHVERPLGMCNGLRPWLGPFTGEPCDEPNRLLIRTASNAYFPEKMTVISLPDRDERVKEAVDAAWEFLEIVENLEDLQRELRRAKVKQALEGIGESEVLREIEQRRSGAPREDKTVKVAELETLVNAQDEVGEDRPGGNYYARSLSRSVWDRPWMRSIERVVLVHRLREVVAQVGFTRFESATADTEGELQMGVRRAALAQEVSWLPAIENRGEGVFLQFNDDKIQNWLKRPAVERRGEELLAGFECWQQEHPGTFRRPATLEYTMLHSFSHMVVTALSLECGYPASAIRERIYALPEIGYGVLLYTGTSDAEGTLGGLIQVGRNVHDLVYRALDMAGLCSNDPVCSQHNPSSQVENRYLQGAACHGCLLIAETSCEQQNDFLDRALVVPTIDNLGTEFFSLSDL